MSSANFSTSRTKKNCLLVFRNKKINTFDGAGKVITAFSDYGYYFDKIAYVAYDSAEDIVNAIRDGRANYENLFILCPYSMDNMLKRFLSAQYSSEFDRRGILNSGSDSVFMLYTDKENDLPGKDIKTILDAKYGMTYEKSYIKIYGISVAQLNAVIYEAKTKCAEIDFSIKENYGDYRIEITYPSSISKSIFDNVMRIIVTNLNENIYAMSDVSLAEQVFQLLKLRKAKISVAESFTGGGVGKKLVDIPGISEVYYEGLNTYSNESKMKRLGVKEATLKRYGPVSEQTAFEMAQGLRNYSHCNVGIATTGIAGPSSDDSKKPVGLIYIAVVVDNNCSVFKYNLDGSRDKITNTSINLALFHTYKLLKHNRS